jgi:hypothetical protein
MPVGRLVGGDVAVLERVPEGAIAEDGLEGVDERGVEPAPAPAARDPAGRADAAVGVEDLDGLREAEDPRGERDLLAGEPVGRPATVPVLVEAADGQGRRLVEVPASGRSRRRGRSA